MPYRIEVGSVQLCVPGNARHSREQLNELPFLSGCTHRRSPASSEAGLISSSGTYRGVQLSKLLVHLVAFRVFILKLLVQSRGFIGERGNSCRLATVPVA